MSALDAVRFYIFTSGDYSDYEIEFLLAGPVDADLDALALEYCDLPESQAAYAKHITENERISREFRLSVPPLERGMPWVKAYKAEQFADWLSANKGFRKVSYQEVNQR